MNCNRADHGSDSQLPRPGNISRRGLLKLMSVLVGGAILDGCSPHPPLSVTSLPAPVTPEPTTALAQVGIAQAASYDPKVVRQQVEALFDGLGGLADVVKPGDRVALKVNLVGGIYNIPPAGTTAPESYVTHPAVARAIGELVLDAGAKELYIVEAVWEWASYENWGYVSMARDIGATLIDLNSPDPYDDFTTLPVGDGWFIYEDFKFNRILEEVDALVSVTKMKCHWLCGITQSMKNLIGLAPYKFYELKPGDGYRTGFHGRETETKARLPRVVIDLNRARPVNLSLIDGIKTVDGSEGPWNQNLHTKSPGLLIGGKNPVATDTIAVAAMGFDPTADYPNAPFLRADNHLNIACQLGMGTNHLDDIEVVGAKLDDVKMKFQPAW